VTDPAQLTGLTAALSVPRLAPYVAACDGDTARALRLYTWNMAVSAAFWPAVHAVEVSFRNAAHDQLVARFGRPDWWEARGVPLNAVNRDQLDKARTRAARTAQRQRRPQRADDVVAELELGFWSALLGKKDGYETAYWNPALHRAFPGSTDPRGAVHDKIDSFRLFRNRIAHHEPVFTRHLAADHAKLVLGLADWLSLDVRVWIESHTRVPALLAARPAFESGMTSF